MKIAVSAVVHLSQALSKLRQRYSFVTCEWQRRCVVHIDWQPSNLRVQNSAWETVRPVQDRWTDSVNPGCGLEPALYPGKCFVGAPQGT